MSELPIPTPDDATSATREADAATGPKASPVGDAFYRLRDFAATGRPFGNGEVFTGNTYDDLIIGHGYDFTREMRIVHERGTGDRPATAEFRILRVLRTSAPDGTLFLRVKLTWEGPDGRHTSYAKYELFENILGQLVKEEERTRQAAAAFARKLGISADAPEEEFAAAIAAMADQDFADVQRTITDAMMNEAIRQVPYNAIWRQEYPGVNEEMELLEAIASGEIADVDTAQFDYHQKAVLDAREREPELLCMLSNSDAGGVEPQELVQLLTWLRAQPETAGKL